MEFRDALSNEMDAFAITGPVALIDQIVRSMPEAGQVIGERIKPDVDDLVAAGDRHSPSTRPFCAARHADIRQSAPEQGDDFVASMRRRNLKLFRFDQIKDPVAVSGKAKKPVFFPNEFK